jgi:hypothetical protein
VLDAKVVRHNLRRVLQVHLSGACHTEHTCLHTLPLVRMPTGPSPCSSEAACVLKGCMG